MSDADTKSWPVPLTQARGEGYIAGRRGLTDAANPYADDTTEARAWVMGLLDGRTKRLKLVEDGMPYSATPQSPQHRL